MGPIELIVLAAGLAVAGFAKGMAGMGLPLIATPIVAGAFGARAAVTIVTIPIFASNTLLLVQGARRRELLRGLGVLIAASITGTAIGTLLLAQLDQRTFAILISAMVAVFLLRGDRLLGDDPTALRARVLGPLVCFVGGVLQGTTSIASPLVGSYFHAQRLPPADFVFVLAAIFELNSIVQLVGYTLQGLYTPEIVALGLIGLVPTLAALGVGIWAREKIDPALFRRLIVVVVVLSVVSLLWRTFAA
ncbi:MAG TPA: sulfite exporter TauE/SafE family protein [Candidatus Limnocylindria bacterium]|nr:sulfite exporter TauE/SafE family protein [Candidatus Limnocylindria bacterium]